ncbi:Glucosyltransferase-like protein [Terramyces sp. JEL0728]|nr:Glucosyltransferase-like protein [Terramyces sp. JEL0728]
MRVTALITELLIYVPAVLELGKHTFGGGSKSNTIVSALIFFPGLLIIDHGHFQYNSAMLGFSLWAIVFIIQKRYILGSISFCCALMFKQMALFYALPGLCVQTGGVRGILLLISIGLSVLLSFGTILLPFAVNWTTNELYLEGLLQVFHRVFPVARGLYEDKVANFWCALSVVVKLRSIFDMDYLLKMSIGTTLSVVLPSCLYLFYKPTASKFIASLAITSLGFFLFSFQVHEKSILLPLLPITVMYHEFPLLAVWFNNVAMFSLFPLLKKDQLVLSYIALLILWNAITLTAWNGAGKIKYFVFVTPK